jgi:ATP-dependent RNA helicase DHX8/PRP22
MTTKEYMHCTTSIEPKWLGMFLSPSLSAHFANDGIVEVAPSFFKVGGGKGELSKRRKNERIQPLFNRFGEGDDSWRLSAQKRQGRGGGGGTWG